MFQVLNSTLGVYNAFVLLVIKAILRILSFADFFEHTSITLNTIVYGYI